jgi:uncharacterized protein YjbI with pentapeptide repeats
MMRFRLLIRASRPASVTQSGPFSRFPKRDEIGLPGGLLDRASTLATLPSLAGYWAGMSSAQMVRKGAVGARRWLARRWRWLTAGIAALVGFLAIAYVVLELAPDWFAETEGLDAQGRADARQSVRTASLALLAGTIGVVGALYTARSFALNRAGQLTDRFTKAIEQLGHPELDVRLGGIYALERIARDSKEDHPQVVEVLTAYVREHSPRPEYRGSRTPASDDEARGAGPQSVALPPWLRHIPWLRGAAPARPQSGDIPERTVPGRPNTDVQAALTVLGRRTLAHEQDATPRLDLSSTHLSWADLDGATLAGANLGETDLRRAHLGGADLRGANLAGANLREASLRGANLAGADLVVADLRKATLWEANLGGAKLSGADFSAATLNGANLVGAYLSEDLYGGDFLVGASLRGAALRGADLRGANLGASALGEASYDDDTTWPDGFDPEAAGARHFGRR